MNLFRRVLTRSGFLIYSADIDGTKSDSEPERLMWAIELAAPLKGKRVADIGCWTGELLRILVPFDPAGLLGIDVLGPWLDVAKSKVPEAAFVGVDSLADLPKSLFGHFDEIFFLETLEHLARGEEQIILSSLALLLSPGGKLIFSTPAAGIAALLDPAWVLVGHRHYRLSTLISLFTSAGFEISKYHYSGNYWASIDTLIFYIYKHLFRRSYTSPSWIVRRSSTGIYPNRRWDSSGIWLEARKS